MKIREFCSFFALAVGVCAGIAQGEEWPVKNATIRVDVNVDRQPDHPQLGVFVKIPDGGMLPSPWVVPEAYDADGKPLETIIVGYNKQDGIGVLFAPPRSGEVSVYLSPSTKQPVKPAGSKIFPSLLLFTRNGKASLDAAKAMALHYPPAQNANFGTWEWCGSMVNPFGADDHYTLWFVGGFILDKPEKIYFATVSDEGSEFSIDGKTIAAWPGVHTRHKGAKGQHGAHVQLGKGLHRIDYFQFELTGEQEAQLVCQRPGVKTESGLPEMMTGIAKSGKGTISKIQFKDGRVCTPIFCSNDKGVNQPVSYFWFGEQPINLFTLTAGPLDAKAKPTWEFGKGKRINEASTSWLASGEPDKLAYPVTLAVENPAGTARTSFWLKSPWTPTAASLDNPKDRLDYRTAFYNMVRSVPPPGDPCADWSSDLWGLLVELLEPYKAGPVLVPIFKHGLSSLQKRPDKQRWALEDRFIETLRLQRKEQELLDWITTFEKAERNGARKFHWKDERICAWLFDLNQPEKARREVSLLKDAAVSPDQTQIAALRLGDVARALGNTDAALKAYRDAEERYRARNKTGMAGGRLTYVGGRKARVKDPSETNAVPNKAKAKKDSKAKAKPATVKKFTLPRAAKGDEWKTYTVRNSSMYTTILSYLQQEALPEALQALADWENESPTAKLEGEYPMAEARVYMFVKDFRRAVNTLDIYTRNTGMTAQLADAMKLEVECLGELKDNARRKALVGDFLKRFPGHPYEEEMKELIQ